MSNDVLQAVRTAPAPASPFRRLLDEALAKLASPIVRDRIVAQALDRARLAAVPEDPAGFGAFAAGELREAIEGTLGEDEAHAVMIDLGPAFATEDVGASGIRRRRASASFAPPHEGAPIAVVASSRPADVEAIVGRLSQRAKAIAVHDVFGLLAIAGRYPTRPLTVVIDDRMQGMRGSILATLARVLPPRSRIVLWGRSDVRPDPGEAHVPIEWVRLGARVDAEAVADACLPLFPAPIVTPRRAPSVLVVHDDARWCELQVERLELAGYDASFTTDPLRALARCLDDAPNAVVTALAMRSLDGARFANLLERRFGSEGPSVLLIAAPPLPDLPAGAVALVRDDASDDLLIELSTWIGRGFG